MNIRTILLVAGLIFLMSWLAACSNEATATPQEDVAAQPAAAPASTAEPTAAPVSASPEAVVGILWKWEAFRDTAGENDITVDDPDRYTMVLMPDGRAGIRADCNQLVWTYTLKGNSLTFNTLGMTTLALCPSGSLDQQYMGLLADVVTWVPGEDGKLVLNLKADAGNVIFANGGPAPTSAGGGVGIDPDQISLDTQGLPYSWQPNVVPEKPYDASQPPGPTGLPEHIQINFGVTDPADRQPGDPIMYIIPVNAYQRMWENAGDSTVSSRLAEIRTIISMQHNSVPLSGLPVLPVEEAVGFNDLAVQGTYLNLGDWDGFRFVGRFAQDANPVTNEGLRYIFQGFSGDGQYLVVFFYPVSTPQLPNSVQDVPQADMEAFNQSPQAHIQGQAERLNGLAGSDWDPNLATLDAVVGSLKIEGAPQSGSSGPVGEEIVGMEWQWADLVETEPAGQSVIPDPMNYTLLLQPDGTFSAKADCNTVNGAYRLDGSNLTLEPEATTMALCSSDSLSEQYVAFLASVERYEVQDGRLLLHLREGAGTMGFQASTG